MPHPPHVPTGLRALAAAFGGDTYAGGRRALLPAPGHSAADRSVSLWLRDGRVLIHSFGAADWRAVRDDLRARGWIDARGRLREGGGGPGPERPELMRTDRVGAARRLWAAAAPLPVGGPAWAHARRRAVDPTLATGGALRAYAATPLAVYRDRGPWLPALLAGVTGPDAEITAVEVTYLDAQGRRSRRARPPRKLVGALPAGSAVRLTPAAPEMLVAEGVFTTLAAMARFGLPGWALLSTVNLRRWTPPDGVRRILIAGDRGPDGERSAEVLRRALAGLGLAADVVLPPSGAGDWNDLAVREGGEEGWPRAPGPWGWSPAAGQEPRHVRNPNRARA